MKIKIILFAVFCGFTSFAQVGINTTVPSSMLNVVGSQEGSYTDVTASTTLDNTHFYVSFTGSTTGQILTLPASVAAPNDFGGRFYHIKNNGTVDITIKGNGTENLRYGSTSSSSNTYVLQAGYFALIVKNNNTSGDTWDVAIVGALPASPTTGSDIKKIIYDGSGTGNNFGDGTKTVQIGELEFSFNTAAYESAATLTCASASGYAATPRVRFLNNTTTKSLYIGVQQQYTTNQFQYANVKLDFTSGSSNTYQYMTPTTSYACTPVITIASPLNINEMNIFHVIDTINDKYYRVSFYISGQSGACSYAIIAEYF